MKTAAFLLLVIGSVLVTIAEDRTNGPSVSVTVIDAPLHVARTNHVVFAPGEQANLVGLIFKLGHHPYYKYRYVTIVHTNAAGSNSTQKVDARTTIDNGLVVPLQDGDTIMFPIWKPAVF